MKPVLEGLLFLMGDDGITYDEIKQILSINDEQLSNLIDELQKDYENTSRGITLNKYGDIYKLTMVQLNVVGLMLLSVSSTFSIIIRVADYFVALTYIILIPSIMKNYKK